MPQFHRISFFVAKVYHPGGGVQGRGSGVCRIPRSDQLKEPVRSSARIFFSWWWGGGVVMSRMPRWPVPKNIRGFVLEPSVGDLARVFFAYVGGGGLFGMRRRPVPRANAQLCLTVGAAPAVRPDPVPDVGKADRRGACAKAAGHLHQRVRGRFFIINKMANQYKQVHC